MQRFEKYYLQVFCRDLLIKTQCQNRHQFVRLKSIQLRHSSKDIVSDKTHNCPPVCGLRLLSGFYPKTIRATHSVAAFKLKTGSFMGCQITLRGLALWDIFTRIRQIILPKQRDFRNLSAQSIHSYGADLGCSQLLSFPECERHFELFSFIAGCDFTIHVQGKSLQNTKLLLSAFQYPVMPLSAQI